MVKVAKRSVVTGKLNEREIDADEILLTEWLNNPRVHVQSAFPDLSVADREFLLNGITPEEWAMCFPPDEPLGDEATPSNDVIKRGLWGS